MVSSHNVCSGKKIIKLQVNFDEKLKKNCLFSVLLFQSLMRSPSSSNSNIMFVDFPVDVKDAFAPKNIKEKNFLSNSKF